VRRDQMLDGKSVVEGDVLLGLASSGLHTNGYSLVRKVFAKEIVSGELQKMKLTDGQTLADALLQPHRCYLKSLRPLFGDPALHALSHITGGGIEENTRRVIPKQLRLQIDWSSWQRPELFRMIQKRGDVSEDEMRHVFNLGIGAIAVVKAEEANRITSQLQRSGEEVYPVGRVAA